MSWKTMNGVLYSCHLKCDWIICWVQDLRVVRYFDFCLTLRPPWPWTVGGGASGQQTNREAEKRHEKAGISDSLSRSGRGKPRVIKERPGLGKRTLVLLSPGSCFFCFYFPFTSWSEKEQGPVGELAPPWAKVSLLASGSSASFCFAVAS